MKKTTKKNMKEARKKLLLFGGTSEEHFLIRKLADYPVAITLCVVSRYGRALLPQDSHKLNVCVGALDRKQMTELMAGEEFFCVVDATHPYAVEVTKNLREAAAATGTPYLRLLRESSCKEDVDCISVDSLQQVATVLDKLEGAALITTGSKELEPFTKICGYRERLYLRVLPTVEAIKACLAFDFLPSHIIAMHGPFSKELNMALMQEFNIKALVTKDGGSPGGFFEKAQAARELGVELIVMRRPEEEGFSAAGILYKIYQLLEGKLSEGQ